MKNAAHSGNSFTKLNRLMLPRSLNYPHRHRPSPRFPIQRDGGSDGGYRTFIHLVTELAEGFALIRHPL
jgi:hypothetical protein